MDPGGEGRGVIDCFQDFDELHEIGCLFPGECCMPGPHFRSECVTADMIEEYEKACEQVSDRNRGFVDGDGI